MIVLRSCVVAAIRGHTKMALDTSLYSNAAGYTLPDGIRRGDRLKLRSLSLDIALNPIGDRYRLHQGAGIGVLRSSNTA